MNEIKKQMVPNQNDNLQSKRLPTLTYDKELEVNKIKITWKKNGKCKNDVSQEYWVKQNEIGKK